MKTLLTTLSILLIATAGYAQGKVYTETELKVQLPFGEANSTEFSKTYTVERVIDGDTLKLTNGEVVQLIGIKAPPIDIEEAKKEVMATVQDLETILKMVATEFVKELMAYKGNAVNLETDVEERDKYDRLLAYAYKLVCLHPCRMRERKGYEYKSFEDGVYIFVNFVFSVHSRDNGKFLDNYSVPLRILATSLSIINRFFPSEPARSIISKIERNSCSSSCCSATNHWRKLLVA